MKTLKRVAIALAICGVLMGVSAAVALYYANNQSSVFGISPSSSSTLSTLNCSYGYYQVNDNCVPIGGQKSATSSTQTASSSYAGGTTSTQGGGCFGCVTISDISFGVEYSGDPDCSGTGFDGGSLGQVIGPDQSSPRTFVYEFHWNWGGQDSNGNLCSGSLNLYLDNSNNIPISIQSVSPSLPVSWTGTQNFYITFYALQGNTYNGNLQLTLVLSGQ